MKRVCKIILSQPDRTKAIKIPESYEEFLTLTSEEKILALKYQEDNVEKFKRGEE